jgi:hypothetical protein
MRRPLVTISLITAGVFGTVGLVNGFQGAPQVSAATKGHVKGQAKVHANTTQTAVARVPHADGKVTAVSGDTITVQADADPAGSDEYTGVTTIVLSSATTYRGTTTKASITVGANIVAEGTVSSDGKTLTASSIGLGGQGGHGGHGGHGGPHADGSVTAVNGNSVTVKADTDAAGSDEYTKVTTVLLTDSTVYGGTTTKATILAGVDFVADGTLSTDGTTLTATHFSIRGSGGHAGHP